MVNFGRKNGPKRSKNILKRYRDYENDIKTVLTAKNAAKTVSKQPKRSSNENGVITVNDVRRIVWDGQNESWTNLERWMEVDRTVDVRSSNVGPNVPRTFLDGGRDGHGMVTG